MVIEDQVNAKNVQHENLQGTDITSEQPLVQEPTPSYLNNEVIDTDEPHREEMEKTDHEVTNVETPIEMNSRETEEFAMNTESEGKYIKYNQKIQIFATFLYVYHPF